MLANFYNEWMNCELSKNTKLNNVTFQEVTAEQLHPREHCWESGNGKVDAPRQHIKAHTLYSEQS